MKKRLIVLFLLFFSVSAAFGTLGDPYRRTQQISGFIDDISFLYISPYHYDRVADNGFIGINLDYSDQANEIRGIISPTVEEGAFTHPGIVIGTFSVLSTFIEGAHRTPPVIPTVKLTIEHEKLKHTTDLSAQLEYELAVSYSINGGDLQTKYCLSTESSTNNKIEISLSQYASNNMVSIQNANIYFRFAIVDNVGVAPTVIGQYESRIVFTLEGT